MPLPTSAQIALALAITKSKPIDVTFTEYFAQLREIIVDDQCRLSIEDHHYIDGVLFWKRAYEKCDTERVELENRVFELEQQLRKTSTSNLTSTAGAEVVVATKERNRDELQPKRSAKANTQSKRCAVESKDYSDTEEVDFAFNSCETPSSCQTLLRCLYNLHHSGARREISIESYGQEIKSLCHAVAHFIKDQCRVQQHSMLARTKEPFRSADILKLTDHSWRTILHALERTTTSVHSNDSLSCISHMVLVFQTLLGQLRQSSLDEADQRTRMPAKSNGRSQSMPVIGVPRPQETNIHAAVRKAMAVALCSMLGNLDESVEIHTRLLEGLVSALLDHIGSALSLIVFSDPKSKDPPEPGLIAPRGLVDVSDIETDVAVMTTAIAAPYLMSVLRKAIDVGKAFSKSSFWSSAHQSPNTSTTNTEPSGIKTRFQETLLRGIFGNSGEDFNRAFMKSSEISLADIGLSDTGESPAQTEPDWLLRQVWEHIGWDVLIEKMEIEPTEGM